MSSAWPLYRAMVGVGLLCGGLIVTVFELTKPVIARNQAEALQAAVFQVLPGVASSRAFRYADPDGFRPLEPGAPADETVVHAGYDASGAFVGVAVEASGMGYQDVIRLLYGYSPVQQRIVGLRVLESKETPGLGDKIQSDAAFAENFDSLDAQLDAASAALAHSIVAVKHGAKTQPWQIDGITGATISSNAVANALNRSVSAWAPRIQAHAAQLQEAR
ncbi:MAG: FMN-binding protein [Acidobacteria bacterium]|nr:FMN-binding protein [Acidobacteriota bacterium]